MPDAMIVSLQPDAVEAGAEVLRAGGNAVDAALACAFGQTVENPDLADTYEQVAAGATDVFYRGDIADRIDADMRTKGGLLRKQDLTACRAETTAPLGGRYRGLDVATNRPPGGGVMLIEMLNMLECFDLRAMGHNTPEYIRTLVEVMKIATSDKDHYVGDPRFVDVPLDRLTDKGYAAEQAAFISEGGRRHVERLGLPESSGTTHLCVVDKQGAIVTMTHSLGMMSGVITPGLGFMYNGCMAVFDPRPGRTGSIEPGKSRFSSMCPTIIFDRGRPLIALGAPGGTQIAMGVLQAIVNFVDFGMTPQEAVLAPRFSATSDTVLVTARIPRYRYRGLESAGYRFNRSPYSYQIASVHAIGFDENGEPSGAADISYGDAMALRVD